MGKSDGTLSTGVKRHPLVRDIRYFTGADYNTYTWWRKNLGRVCRSTNKRQKYWFGCGSVFFWVWKVQERRSAVCLWS